jgi:hypothetical protein
MHRCGGVARAARAVARVQGARRLGSAAAAAGHTFELPVQFKVHSEWAALSWGCLWRCGAS